MNISYIELIRDLSFPDTVGRYTNIVKGAYGFLLNNEKIIERVFQNFTEKQKKECLDMLENSKQTNRETALLAGYLCELEKTDYKILKEPPKMAPVISEII